MTLAAGVEGSSPVLNITIFGLFVVVTLFVVFRASRNTDLVDRLKAAREDLGVTRQNAEQAQRKAADRKRSARNPKRYWDAPQCLPPETRDGRVGIDNAGR